MIRRFPRSRSATLAVEPDKFHIMVGGGSQDIRQQAEFEITP